MSNFQSTVRLDQTTGLPGEFAEQGPNRSFPGFLNSADAAANVFSRAFTHVSGQDNQVEAGGLGEFAGFLISPKEHALIGDSAGTLEPSLTLPNSIDASMCDMGIIFATLENAASIGDQIEYDDGTGTAADSGQLYALAPGAGPTAGRAIAPNVKVTRHNTTGAGLAIIQITN